MGSIRYDPKRLEEVYGISAPKDDPDQTRDAKKPRKTPLRSNVKPANLNGKNNAGGSKDKTATSHREATAPYNFVDLAAEILASPLDAYRNQVLSDKQQDIIKGFRAYLTQEPCYDGYIDLDMETLTPLFIGGNGEQSFAPVAPKTPLIPGSTIRGMVKNLFKMVTLGAMRPDEDFYDRHLYFRCIMTTNRSEPWEKELHDFYSSQMTDGKVSKTKPGFLIKTPQGYFICPMLEKPTRVLVREDEKKFGDKIARDMKDVRVEWHGKVAYAISGSKSDTKSDKAKKDKMHIGKQFVLEYPLDKADWSREHWIEIDARTVQEYRDDKNRRGVNLTNLRSRDKKGGAIDGKKLRELVSNAPKDIEFIAPCYYLADDSGQQVKSFGHGRHFRIAYPNSIGDAVPAELKKDTIDFADAVFGASTKRRALWSSRVFFEDAYPVGEIEQEDKDKGTIHPLLSANPTSYQLYLQQQKGSPLIHWGNPAAKIRGYKLYWHSQEKDWQATPKERKMDEGKAPDKKMTHDITPLCKGSRFKARIRFRDLHAAELGALLMVFDLNGAKNIAYKMGQGKAWGLGSIRIQPTLFLETQERYRDLFGDSGWNLPAVETEGTQFLTAFKEFVGAAKAQDIWAGRMNIVAGMLNYDDNLSRPKWEENTKSMSGDVSGDSVDERYKTRAILPKALAVIKRS